MRSIASRLAQTDTHTFILAGGYGKRLYPLTRDRAKPAVPFAGNYRIIDFTLSNAIHSGFRKIELLTQYKSYSLDRHVLRGWNFMHSELGEYLRLVPPQQRIGEAWYRGTADAIYQNIYSLERERPKLVVILGGDHIYRMDYHRLIETHLENEADLTVACVKVPKARATEFGVMHVDADSRVTHFLEKPDDPPSLPDDPDHSLASMGIYVFNTEPLVRNLIADAKNDSTHDFGRDIIPAMIEKNRVFAHPFIDEETGQPCYWSDIGTLESYFETSMAFLRPEPPIDLADRAWPILTYHPQTASARILSSPPPERGSECINAMIGAGSQITDARVENSILGAGTVVEPGATVLDSILFDGVRIGKGAKLRNTIVDKHVQVPPEMTIGLYRDEDQRRFTVTDSGLVILPKQLPIYQDEPGEKQ